MFLTIAFRLRLSVVVVGVTSRASAVDDHSLRLRRIEEYEGNMMNLLYTSRYSRSTGTVVRISDWLMSWLEVCTWFFFGKGSDTAMGMLLKETLETVPLDLQPIYFVSSLLG